MSEDRSDVKSARWERGYESRYMAHADNWVMVRRPGSIPYTIFLHDWLALPLAAEGRKYAEQYKKALLP